MGELFPTGRIVDLILGLVAIETVVLVAYHRRTGRGVAPLDLAANLLSGVFLLLALRAALTQAWWGFVALPLAAALAAHMADLGRRWRRKPNAPGSR